MMFGKLLEDARWPVLVWASEEARSRGDRRIGTLDVLLAVLHDSDSGAAQALGVDLNSARAADAALDRKALAAVGIHARGFGPLPGSEGKRGILPLTSGARAVVKRAMQEAHQVKYRRISTTHLLLALLACDAPDPAAELLEELGVDRSAVRERVVHSSRKGLK